MAPEEKEHGIHATYGTWDSEVLIWLQFVHQWEWAIWPCNPLHLRHGRTMRVGLLTLSLSHWLAVHQEFHGTAPAIIPKYIIPKSVIPKSAIIPKYVIL